MPDDMTGAKEPMRCHTCLHWRVSYWLQKNQLKNQTGECVIELGEAVEFEHGPETVVVVDAMWGCRSWEVCDGD